MLKHEATAHAAVWATTASKLQERVEQETIIINDQRILPGYLCAVRDLALAVSQSYRELAE